MGVALRLEIVWFLGCAIAALSNYYGRVWMGVRQDIFVRYFFEHSSSNNIINKALIIEIDDQIFIDMIFILHLLQDIDIVLQYLNTLANILNFLHMPLIYHLAQLSHSKQTFLLIEFKISLNNLSKFKLIINQKHTRYSGMSSKSIKYKNMTNFDKEQQRIFQIITGKIRYPSKYFRDYDLAPDLIIKLTVPTSQYIPKSNYLQLSNYVAFPSQKMQRSFQKAQKIIIEEMNQNKQNTDPSNLKIRLQKAIENTKLSVKETYILNDYNQQEPLEIESIYKHTGILDAFSLQYNAIVYILQEICGFRVRSFLLYDEMQENKEIFLFLTLSSENLVNLARKYRIKKQIDYTFIDFFLNDPTGNDDRPLKYASSVKADQILLKQIKSINRYFRVNHSSHETTDIIQQNDLTDDQLNNFRDYIQEITNIYEYYKYKCTKDITNREKSYIFEYNRKKLNKGCEDMYALIKQRRQFFNMNKRILEKYGFAWHDQPLAYQQFNLPDKQSKNSSFFQKLYSLLLYKPMLMNENGDLDLFVNMQKSKLCYLIIKNHFKVNYLKKMGFDFLTLSNNFEKFGNSNNDNGIEGGINGKNLQSDWPIYCLSSNIDTIRNYVGDNVAFQIMITNELIIYFLAILLPYIWIYIIEQIFGEYTYIYTTLIQTILFAISYQVYLFFWQVSQNQYIKNYSDAVSSKIFLSNHRGPYKRNLLTDEVNQFQPFLGYQATIINTLCAMIILTLLVIMGVVFYGCRMLLISIYDPLSHYKVSNISLPHIVSYLVFFISVDLAAIIATNRLISLMIYLQNPPTDEQEQQWRQTLTFFYLIGLEIIPSFFFFIIEPFNGTSCYSDSCLVEIQLYVFARMIITFIIASFRLAHVFLFKYLHMKQFFKKDPPVIYQDKLSNLLNKAIKESKKKNHTIDNNYTIVVLVSYSIYVNVLPLISILAFIAIFMQYTNTRLGILYEQRRPLNRSQKILLFSKSAKVIFYIGIFAQSWISVFLFQFVQTHFQEIIQKLSTTTTYQGIFLFKLLCVCVYFLVLLSLSKVVQSFVQGYSNDALLKRKNHKFKEYLENRGNLKIELKQTLSPIPLRSVFRSYNPQKTNGQLLQKMLQSGDRQVSIPSIDDEAMQNADSLINITFKHLK